MKTEKLKSRRRRRKLSIRNKIKGTVERPRIAIFKSNKNLYAQIIDDSNGVTLCASSTLDKDLNLAGKCNKEAGIKVGDLLAKKAKEKKITKVVLDRNGYRYHGIVKEFSDACRKGGLEF